MKALVLGAGHMGTFHRRVLADLGHDVTTVDPAPGRADYTAVPSRPFDVVCVASPIDTLAEQAARWVGHAGWLLIEKPGAANYREAADLASELAGQRVAVGYVERFNPRVLELRDALSTSDAPQRARFWRWNDRSSADVALDLASHDLDLVRYLALDCAVTMSHRASAGMRLRRVTVHCGARSYAVNLMAHTESPLHGQWAAFLADGKGCAGLDDATAVHAALRRPVAA